MDLTPALPPELERLLARFDRVTIAARVTDEPAPPGAARVDGPGVTIASATLGGEPMADTVAPERAVPDGPREERGT